MISEGSKKQFGFETKSVGIDKRTATGNTCFGMSLSGIPTSAQKEDTWSTGPQTAKATGNTIFIKAEKNTSNEVLRIQKNCMDFAIVGCMKYELRNYQ